CRRLAVASTHDDVFTQGIRGPAAQFEMTVLRLELSGERKLFLLERQRSLTAQHQVRIRSVEQTQLFRAPCDTSTACIARADGGQPAASHESTVAGGEREIAHGDSSIVEARAYAAVMKKYAVLRGFDAQRIAFHRPGESDLAQGILSGKV